MAGLPLGEVPEEELSDGPVSSLPSVLLLGLSLSRTRTPRAPTECGV